MKRLFFLLFLFSSPAFADERDVLFPDDSGAGTLRYALEVSCGQSGDDTITFILGKASVIRLETPLIIPADCNGTITITGPKNEVVLDGSEIEAGAGILIVESWGNTIEGLTFVGYENGAGLVLEDGDNRVEGSFFGVTRGSATEAPNLIGIRVSSDWNVLHGNTVTANLEEGIILEGNANTVEANRIGDRTGSCPDVVLPEGDSDDYPTFVREVSHELISLFQWSGTGFMGKRRSGPERSDLCGNGGAGVRITGDRNLVGGDVLVEGNKILFNGDRGIVVADGERNRFSRNVIAYNEGPGIALEGKANDQIEPLQTLRTFPVEAEPGDGSFRYTLLGVGEPGTTVDLYRVAADETDDSDGRGEGAEYLEGFTVSGEFFTRTLEREDLPPGSRISALTCDKEGNCSEFSQNATLGRDLDHDSLLDPTEDTDMDLWIDPGESDPLLNDTDGDGLPDPLEDRNENGEVDPDETDPQQIDTDDDGISDFVETGGDGRFDSGDTDPNNPNTDGDGLMDGEEDLNQNGVIELGETDPTDPDTDDDGNPD